jgi:RNA polymerase sigma-70 factor (ECF subfamily)
VHRWEQTDDVFQAAAMRLSRALKDVTPRDTREFFGLAARQVRWELLNMAETYRHRLTPSELGQISPCNESSDNTTPREPIDQEARLDELELWTEFHRAADALPGDHRGVFRLIWYGGLTQKEAASVLSVSEKTVKNHWRDARLAIYRELGGRLPGI